jgi:CheY-like chemotaxis protein
VPDDTIARAILPERPWDTILIDHALGMDRASALARAAADVPQRIVLITPGERHELLSLMKAGFNGYLVKPVRAASLAARFTEEDAQPIPGEQAEETAPSVGGKGLAVLVAEDNEINALLSQALLVRLGHRPTVVADGAAAVAAWETATNDGVPFDCILMDVQMPELDGLDATRRVRAIEAARNLARTPIVALTANALGEDREACLAAGMDDFLVKPLDREKLADVLTRSAKAAPLAA